MSDRFPRARPPWWLLLLTVLVAAEVGLQVFFVGYRWWATRTRTNPMAAADFTILCLGDSHTFGVGAEPQQSYVRQLEQLLQHHWPDHRIRVANAGAPSFNSSQVLHRLVGLLDAMRPDLLLILVGRNDRSNFREVDFDTLEALEAPWATRLHIRLDQWLSVFQLYRLARLVAVRQSAWGRRAWAEKTSAEHVDTAGPREPFFAELRQLLTSHPEATYRILRRAGQPVSPPLARGPHDWMLRHMERVLARHPDNIQSVTHFGHLFLWAGRDDVAQQLYARALDMASNESDALLARAEISMGRRTFTRARPLWEQLVEQDPTNPGHRVRLGQAQLAQGAPDDAIESALTALTFKPQMSGAYDLLGEAFMAQGDWEHAQAMFRRTVELDPSRVWSWIWLGYGYEQSGDVEQARAVWREWFQRSHHPTALARLGRSYERPDDARATMRALLDATAREARRDPAYWQPYERLIDHGVHPDMAERLLRANVEEMVRRAAARGVRVGLLTYPNAARDSWMNRTMRAVATERPEVLLIDAAHALSHAFSDSDQPLLAADGHHPNAQGYGLLARYVMDTLEGAAVLEGQRIR